MSNELKRIEAEDMDGAPQALMIAEPHGIPSGITKLGSAEQMVQRLDEYSQRIKAVHQWMLDNFEPGIDYGKADDRTTKDSLLKPGAEKVCNFFQTTPVWSKDDETWEMLGRPAGTICFICRIVDNASGMVIGEGRGAETLGNKKRDANKTIKIAKKNALVDAALSTFCLSERFTQDSPEQRSLFETEKNELKSFVAAERAGCDSSMTNNQFLKRVAENYLHEMPQTVGALRKLRSAIAKGMYDLATGEKIPE